MPQKKFWRTISGQETGFMWMRCPDIWQQKERKRQPCVFPEKIAHLLG
jgi:hypothetical protein